MSAEVESVWYIWGRFRRVVDHRDEHNRRAGPFVQVVPVDREPREEDWIYESYLTSRGRPATEDEIAQLRARGMLGVETPPEPKTKEPKSPEGKTVKQLRNRIRNTGIKRDHPERHGRKRWTKPEIAEMEALIERTRAEIAELEDPSLAAWWITSGTA